MPKNPTKEKDSTGPCFSCGATIYCNGRVSFNFELIVKLNALGILKLHQSFKKERIVTWVECILCANE